jgi:hypothetical protein
MEPSGRNGVNWGVHLEEDMTESCIKDHIPLRQVPIVLPERLSGGTFSTSFTSTGWSSADLIVCCGVPSRDGTPDGLLHHPSNGTVVE